MPPAYPTNAGTCAFLNSGPGKRGKVRFHFYFLHFWVHFSDQVARNFGRQWILVRCSFLGFVFSDASALSRQNLSATFFQFPHACFCCSLSSSWKASVAVVTMSRVAWNARIALPKPIYSRQFDFELPLPGREPPRSRVRSVRPPPKSGKKTLPGSSLKNLTRLRLWLHRDIGVSFFGGKKPYPGKV